MSDALKKQVKTRKYKKTISNGTVVGELYIIKKKGRISGPFYIKQLVLISRILFQSRFNAEAVLMKWLHVIVRAKRTILNFQ